VSQSRTQTRPPVLDDACAQAVEEARTAAEEIAGPGQVGDHIEARPEADRVATHLFECQDPAYRGWRWAVTVARAPRARTVTVNESTLLPGPDALRAPEWVPWRDRLQPGDVGVGDLLPVPGDDERLVPVVGLEGGEDEPWPNEAGPAASPPVAVDRKRVLSPAGRDETAQRWYSLDHGPRTPLAHAAPAVCVSCGFFVALAGPLGQLFGVCANAYAPDDGRVVSVDHGCGAHSEAALPAGADEPVPPIIDELGYDLVDMPGVSVEETIFEPFDHT
jgi:Protein of unknown function (DUF3027)